MGQLAARCQLEGLAERCKLPQLDPAECQQPLLAL